MPWPHLPWPHLPWLYPYSTTAHVRIKVGGLAVHEAEGLHGVRGRVGARVRARVGARVSARAKARVKGRVRARVGVKACP